MERQASHQVFWGTGTSETRSWRHENTWVPRFWPQGWPGPDLRPSEVLHRDIKPANVMKWGNPEKKRRVGFQVGEVDVFSVFRVLGARYGEM